MRTLSLIHIFCRSGGQPLVLGHLTPSRIRVRGAFGRTSGRIPWHGQFPQSCGLQILVENLEALQMELPRLTVDLKRIMGISHGEDCGPASAELAGGRS